MHDATSVGGCSRSPLADIPVVLNLESLLHGATFIHDEKVSSFSLDACQPENLTCLDVEIENTSSSSHFVSQTDLSFPFPSLDITSDTADVSILHINIRGWRSHFKELETYLAVMPKKPLLVSVNETFLNHGCSAELFGYRLVGRRDRPSNADDAFTDSLQSWGGVLLFVLKDFDGSVAEVHKSEHAERMWFVLHMDIGPVLLGIMYRPPSPGNIETISTLATELVLFRDDMVGTILVGDFNCHNIRWLRHSAGMTTEGKALHRFSMDHGLEQIVRDPTRGKYLLDLVLTDLGKAASACVLPGIADHNVVLARFCFSLETFSCPPRTVWCYHSADWIGLNEYLSEVDFSFLSELNVHDGAQQFTQLLLDSAKLFIHQKDVSCEASAHPWLTDSCRAAILKKHSLVNTREYKASCIECSTILNEEFQHYVQSIKDRMKKMRRGSKEYWNLVKKLMMGSNHSFSVPTLIKDNTYSRFPSEKANLLADTFRAKWIIPDIVANFYSDYGLDAAPRASSIIQLRSRHACYHLSTLVNDSATGPDDLSTILLRQVAKTICRAFAILGRRIIETGSWPICWKGARICPLNYRGLHLTSQLSKCMERFIGAHFMYRLSYTSFGTSLFAYRKFHGSRDALTFVVLTWLLAFALGKKIALYCSDVAGAFDRVKSTLLLSKLRRSGIHPSILAVLADWLVGRYGEVTVHGHASNEFALSNMTFQGTVWGPCLWNVHFSDVSLATRKCAFDEIVFADDLNAFREFENHVSLDFLLVQLGRCQTEVHRWGQANGVSCEPSKESMHVLSHTHHYGSSFKLLGVLFDVQLTMGEAVAECASEAHWRLSAILRTRRFFSLVDLILQCKSQVLSYLEYRTCAVSHAADIHLYHMDSVQRRFLTNVGLSTVEALRIHNLAPLSCRRDISNLGIIYRAITKRGPKKL